MRDTFVAELNELAKVKPELLLITGDLGFGVLEDFARSFPAQFINAGVAEQNMTGLAAGLALESFVVFTYSIANFPTLRCLEQIRNDVLYHNLPVNIVSIGGGFSYGALGMSHHATEDIAILSSLPNLRIYTPCSDEEVVAATREMVVNPKPSYLRLDKSKINSTLDTNLKIKQHREGNGTAVLCYGGIVQEVLNAADQISNTGEPIGVYSLPKLKPFPDEEVCKIASMYKRILSVEEHVIRGGLGSMISEVLLEKCDSPPKLTRLGIRDRFTSAVGDQNYLRSVNLIDANSIVNAIQQGRID